MERVVILGALSSFQIFHQCSTNNLWLSHYFRGIHLSLLATSFPAGKLLGTVIVPMASRRSGLERTLLLDAFLLTAGSLLSIIPRWWSLCVGRALIGIGSGIGFVTCTVILHATTTSENRPSAYFIFAILYSSALLLANLIPPFGLLSYPLMSLLTALPAFIPGALYLLARISAPSTEFVNAEENASPKQQRPIKFCYLLMALNASIGVPLYQSFSSTIFISLGMSTQAAVYLSAVYPILQLVLIFHIRSTSLTRRQLVLGGYAVVLVAFAFLLTAIYFDARQLAVALVVAIAVITSVPCNTALCLISESFDEQNERIVGTATSRTVMWVGSTLSSATFLMTLHAWGLLLAILPYFITSLVLFVLLFSTFPDFDCTCSQNDSSILTEH
ncbi:hypothetical protein Tcan_15429 [Toxocara canis]|uniref:MFS domain-containing protein n=1 Tax=Toxocara canis TaxID=6265 RepID=A0A0B2VPX1_TOXCA|nr:hypothetical protein Tcan_15429 [Toxocara canis]